MENKKVDRIVWIDYAKAIGIYLVILQHLNLANTSVDTFINSFHMPLFFLLSGFCFTKKKTVDQILHDFKTLLLPNIFLYMTCYPYWFLKMQSRNLDFSFQNYFIKPLIGLLLGSAMETKYSFVCINVVWFCVSLFLIKLIVNLLLNMKTHIEILNVFVIVFLAVILVNRDIYIPFSLRTVFLCIPFFLLGVHSKKYLNFLVELNVFIKVFLSVSFFIISYFLSQRNGLLHVNEGVYGKYVILYYINALLGGGCVILLSASIKKRHTLLSYIGQNIIIIMFFEVYGFAPFKFLYLTCFVNAEIGSNYMPLPYALVVAFLTLFLCMIPIVLINKFFPFLVGKKYKNKLYCLKKDYEQNEDIPKYIEKTKIAIIGTVGVPACYGGFESLVDNLLDFTPPNVEYTVFCSAPKYPNKLETYKGAKLIYLDRDANGISSIFYDYECMKCSIALGVDIMLVLGVSGCIFLPLIRHKFKGKIITNIDGLEWKRAKWKFYAKWLLQYSEKQAVKYSDVVIGDNKGITDYVKDAYKKDAVLIAYGGDHVKKVEDDSLFGEYPFAKEKYAVTVCRIEPENNIHIILEAFRHFSEFPLVIVGNWGKSEYGEELKSKYSNFDHIHLLDSIYESNRINWIRSHACLYIHGHSAGGTNPSLVEAMNLGLPIFAFDCVYNRATTLDKAFYWKTSNDLLKLLNSISDDGKKNCSVEMKYIAEQSYTWENIAKLYNSLYN